MTKANLGKGGGVLIRGPRPEGLGKVRAHILAGCPGSDRPLEDGGSIVFSLHDGTEMMRLDPSGEVFVRGQKVDSNPTAYVGFVDFLVKCGL